MFTSRLFIPNPDSLFGSRDRDCFFPSPILDVSDVLPTLLNPLSMEGARDAWFSVSFSPALHCLPHIMLLLSLNPT